MPEPLSFLSPLLRLLSPMVAPIRKYYAQPKVAVKLEFGHRGRITHGMSHNNTFPPNGEPLLAGDLGKYNQHYEVNWRYELMLTNNSEVTAYRLKFPEHDGIRITIDPPFDYTLPLAPNARVEHELTARTMFEGTPDEADSFMREGPATVLRIEYQNLKGRRYYTDHYPKEKDEDLKNVYGVVE